MSKHPGINEKKISYTCKTCGEFQIFSRQVGDEHVRKTKRSFCYRCDDLRTFELDQDFVPPPLEEEDAISM